MITIQYAKGGCKMRVDRIAAWNRGDIPAMMMSASSGPKNYFKNQIFSVFESDLKIEQIVMMRGRGPTFLLLRVGGFWYDRTGKQVIGERLDGGKD